MPIKPEVLSLELERVNLLSNIDNLERYLKYADGSAYDQDSQRIYDYNKRLVDVEIKLQVLRGDKQQEERKKAATELYEMSRRLTVLTMQGYFSQEIRDIIAPRIASEINNLLGV